MRRLAACLGTKLSAVASGTVSGPTVAFRSSDGKQWLTASIGRISVAATFPPPVTPALAACVQVAVVNDLAAHGVRSLPVDGVARMPPISPVATRSLDLRTTADIVTARGAEGTAFVDLIWLTGGHRGEVLDVVDVAVAGDLSSADNGLVAQVTDAAARQLAAS